MLNRVVSGKSVAKSISEQGHRSSAASNYSTQSILTANGDEDEETQPARNSDPEPKPIPKIIVTQPSKSDVVSKPKRTERPNSTSKPKKDDGNITGSGSGKSPILMKPPPGIPGIPTGLGFLIPIIFLFIKPRTEITEVTTDVKAVRHYDIVSGNGQRIYVAAESPGSCEPGFLRCGENKRTFKLEILDFYGRTIIMLKRRWDPLLYCSGGAGGGSMTVDLGDGTRLGKITHSFDCYTPHYNILDGKKKVIMRIEGTKSTCMDCFGCLGIASWYTERTEFDIVSSEDGYDIGVIRKNFRNYVPHYVNANPDNFGVEFRGELDVKSKALVLAAVFLIDIMHFQKDRQIPATTAHSTTETTTSSEGKSQDNATSNQAKSKLVKY